MKKGAVSFLLILVLGAFFSDYLCAVSLPKHFSFYNNADLDGWEKKFFHGRVNYEIVYGAGKSCVRAESDNAASGLFYRILFDPRERPYIAWSWMVSRFPSKATVSSLSKKRGWMIERDDYAARLYIIFPTFIFTRTECLEYVWSSNLPKGTILASPFFDNTKLVVVESGEENKDKWVYVTRNIVEDYEKAFGKPLRRKVGVIGLMTDSDNTQSKAVGYYANIRVGQAAKGQPPASTSVAAKEGSTASFFRSLRELFIPLR